MNNNNTKQERVATTMQGEEWTTSMQVKEWVVTMQCKNE
jgi:hypothetical protein